MRDTLLDEERDVPAGAHAINLLEVHYNVQRNYSLVAAEAAIVALQQTGVMERRDMDAAFWRDAATLIATQRASGHSLALGDACGLALARREGADFTPQIEPS